MKRLTYISILLLIKISLYAQVQDEKDICGEIERFNDDSSSTVELHSPGMWNNKVMPIVFSKMISKVEISFTLYLSTHSDMVFKDGKGVVVIFTDSTIWQKPGKINTYKINNSYEYNTVIDLTPPDVLLFSTKKIAKYMLYIFNQEIDKAVADSFQKAVNCVKAAE